MSCHTVYAGAVVVTKRLLAPDTNLGPKRNPRSEAKTGPVLPPRPAPVSGVSVRRPGAALETVTSALGRLHLLASNDNLEVTEIDLAAGARLFLEPAPELVGLSESYYVLSGEVWCDLGASRERLEPGACLTVQELEGQVVLGAKTAVRLLYISSRPLFHAVSAHVEEMMRLATEIEQKDGYTSDHCQRIQTLAMATGEVLRLPGSSLCRLNFGAFLHDVGKIRVPLPILNKPGTLTEEEWEVVKRHPSFGRELLEPTSLRAAGRVVEQHHERLDGSGYPYGLRGDEILVEAYIVAVADTYDAMTTDRPYRKALRAEDAFAELERYAGVHYPTDVVRAFRKAVKRVEANG